MRSGGLGFRYFNDFVRGAWFISVAMTRSSLMVFLTLLELVPPKWDFSSHMARSLCVVFLLLLDSFPMCGVSHDL